MSPRWRRGRGRFGRLDRPVAPPGIGTPRSQPTPGRRVDLLTRVAGGFAAIGLAVAGVAHVVWMFTPWPLATWADFARVVLGTAASGPPAAMPAMSAAVAALLFAGAYLAAARAWWLPPVGPRRLHQVGSWIVTAALIGRATVAGFLPSGLGLSGAPTDYVHWDLLLYSPLCLVLGGLTAAAAFPRRLLLT